MRIPFRRRNPQLEDPNGRVFMSADEMFAALDAETAKPKPEPSVHYLLGAEDRLACGAALGPATHSASNPQWTTCGACKRTRIWKHAVASGTDAAK